MSQVVVVLGSESDKEITKESGMLAVFNGVEVTYEISIISAHRHPDALREYCLNKEKEGTLVFIGVAGLAAALPGAIASYVRLRPVIGVPLTSEVLEGFDALLSMVRMPSYVPVAVPGIDKIGLRNAAILACQIIGLEDTTVYLRLKKFFEETAKKPEYNIVLETRREK